MEEEEVNGGWREAVRRKVEGGSQEGEKEGDERIGGEKRGEG